MADILIDSNVLARYLDTDNSAHQEIKDSFTVLVGKKNRLCYVPQVAVEMANFLTRPADENGFGLTPAAAGEILDRLSDTFTLRFPDAQTEYSLFRDLQRELAICGKQVHDIRIVAACRSLGIRTLLTFNVRHFAGSVSAGHVEVLTPAAALQS